MIVVSTEERSERVLIPFRSKRREQVSASRLDTGYFTTKSAIIPCIKCSLPVAGSGKKQINP